MGGLLETLFLILAIIVYIIQFLKKEKESNYDFEEIPTQRPKKREIPKTKAKEPPKKPIEEPSPKLVVPQEKEVVPEETEGNFFEKFSHFSEEEKLVIYSEILTRKDC